MWHDLRWRLASALRLEEIEIIARSLAKRLGRVVALDYALFEVRVSVVALLGANGSGDFVSHYRWAQEADAGIAV